MPDAFNHRRYLIPFRATLLPQIFTDVLVIGGGVAGMRAAIGAAAGGADVIVAAKGRLEESSTAWAQGGIAAVLTEDDSPDEHVRDTMVAGADLCDEPAVREVVDGGPARVRELAEWGMKFDLAHATGGDGDDDERVSNGNGRAAAADDGDPVAGLAFGREGGHGRHRIVHVDGDATGRALARTLHAHLTAMAGVRWFSECFVLDLITTEGTPGRCLGAITHHPKYGLQVIWAGATVLAAGGGGMVYRETTNPRVSTGDGLAMAYRAGVELQDLAFVQFHPTTLYVAGASRSLITEAVRGEGGRLIDRSGHAFMPEYDERGDLAPRDIVSRSILQQCAATDTSHVYLDVRHLPRFAERFPGIDRTLKRFDIDAKTQPIPVHPAAHYTIGGVRTDLDGRTSLPGLLCCGEAACTGLNGANRLASNSLLEGLVMGEAVGRAALEELADESRVRGPIKIVSDIPISDRSELDLPDVRSSLRSVMWRHVGIERDGDRMAEVEHMIAFWARYTMDKIFDDRTGWEAQNLLTVGALITRSAIWRCESRGTHHRVDFDRPTEAFRVHDVWRRGEDAPTTRPVLAEAAAATGQPVHSAP
ncbi:MAG: L-aspartate oxidase [Planctomycetota bacterium]